MKFTDHKTGALIHNTYTVYKYAGGNYCGSANNQATIDRCIEFANDGFCDYCRIVCDNDGSVLKIHFTTPEQDVCEPANPNFY